MASHILAGVYDSYDAAQLTATDLEAAHVPYEDISILTHHSDGRAGVIDTPPGGEAGAKVGAATGTVLGAGAGLLAGLSLFAIPAIGQIAAAGWAISALVGAGVGAGFGSAAGGLIGSLVEAGVTRDEAHFYAEAVRRGCTVLLVKAADHHETPIAEILRRHALVDTEARREAYHAGGWTEFNESAPAYTPAEVEAERQAWKPPYRGPQFPPV